jgi:4-amino-4-deoxy-L-arabinose transferase-like glycosyltransferase
MKRNWNWPLWAGFIAVLAGFLTYTFFVRFPLTRDFPWVNLLLFAAGGILLAIGLRRAIRQPELYRGRVFGSIFAVLGLCLFAFFAFIVFYELRQLPSSAGAPRVGQKAPNFTLPDQDNHPVALGDLISAETATRKPGGALLIFYRGFW